MKGVLVVYVGLFITGLVGWIMNIISILELETIEMIPVTVLRLIGIIMFPLGAGMGYIS